jgi:hypothetical protein
VTATCCVILDMFDWFYEDIEIYDYDKTGRETSEDQEKFD